MTAARDLTVKVNLEVDDGLRRLINSRNSCPTCQAKDDIIAAKDAVIDQLGRALAASASSKPSLTSTIKIWLGTNYYPPQALSQKIYTRMSGSQITC